MIGSFMKRGRRHRREATSAPEAFFLGLAGARPEGARTPEDRRRDFRAVLLGTPAGRRVLYEILAWAHVFASTFVPGDAYATHWREGGRDVGLRILAVLAPDAAASTASGAPGDGGDTDEGARP